MPTRFDPRERLLGSLFGARVSQWMNRSFVKNIQPGSVVITTAASATAAIVSVDTNNTVLFFQGVTTDVAGPNPSAANCRIVLTNATTVTATTSGVAQSHVVNFTAVELYPGVIKSLTLGTISLSGATSATAAVTVDATKSFALFMGSSQDVSDDRAQARVTLTNGTTVTAVINTSGLGTTIIGYTVVELF